MSQMQPTASQASLTEVTSPRQTKQQKKKQEEQKKLEVERLDALKKEQLEAKEKLQKDQIESFKNKNRIHLDFVHAFGNYTGPQHFDIEGQLYMLKGKFDCGDNHGKKDAPLDEYLQISKTINARVSKQKINPQEQFQKNQLIYPVGRHIALKDLDSNQMKFLLLPQDSLEVMSMTFNHKRDLLAVAVKTWVFMSQERHHINILFYQIEEGMFKRQRQLNIKATKGSDPLPLCYVDYREKQKIGGYQTKQKMYERYANSLTFSKDDKYFTVCIRNGPSECVVQSYDMLMGGKRSCFGKFDFIINKVTYMPRDNQKLVIAGDNVFKFYSTSSKQLVGLYEFEDMPINPLKSDKNPQSFTSFCYRENDHLVGCTNLGDIIIIEVMDVIQKFDTQSLIAPGSEAGSRLKFNHVIPNRFGFVAASDDVLYFFQYKPNKEGSKLKGKGHYICLLKWRAPEFKGTRITSLSLCESPNDKEQEDTNMAIATKNNQILYMNLYQQVYYPDHLKLINEMKLAKHVDGSESEESSLGSDNESDDSVHKIKSQGIEEEDQLAEEMNKHKNLNSVELKKLAAKKENQALIDEIKYFAVASGFHTGEISYMDICIQRPIIATLSKTDSTIRVWNYDTGECELSKSYVQLQKEFASSNQTYLQSIALHPSGFYLAIGFIDKVKIYHLMQSEIRMYKALDIKNCHTMKFSNGGQLLACVDLKDISIFNSYTLDKPKKQPGPSSYVSNIDFNDNDTLLTVVSKDGFIQKYDLTKGAAKTGECIIDKTCSFSSVIYSKLPRTVNPDDTRTIDELNSLGFDLTYTEKVYVVGTYNNKSSGDEMMIRCYNEKDNAEDYIQVKSPFGAIRFTDILDVMGPISGKNMEDYDHSKRARNLILALDNGRIYMYGMPPNLVSKREAFVMNTHHGSINSMKCSEDNQIVVSAGQDGSVFVYRVSEKPNDSVGAFSKKNDERTERFNRQQRNEQIKANQDVTKKKQKDKEESDETQEDQKQGQQQQANNSESESDEDPNDSFRKRKGDFEVIDQRLSNIVLIEKQMMDKWRQQQEELKLDMEKENNTVESSLRREKYLHETKISQMEANKSKQLNKLNAEYESLQTQEAQQKDDNTQIMKKMELNHSSCMEELHSLFEKKLQIEQQQFNKLSHEKEELKGNFELEIKELTKMNEQAIEKLLNDFKDELQKVQDEYDKSKRTADGYKMIYEERLTQTEDDNEGEIDVEKNVNQKEIQQLNDVIDTIKDDIETIKRQAKREEDETDMFNKIAEKARLKKKFREEIMKEKIEEITQLENEKKEIQEKLKEKERELYRYKFKIKDLQKTKQVLTHRTQEMKASLEPKEQQIENLKEQLLDLENVFNKQLTALHNLEFVVIPKKKSKIEEMETEYKKEQGRTKMREQTINQFVNKVQMASYKNKDGEQMVKSKDSKKIYENYAKLGDDEIYKMHIMEIYETFVRKHMSEILENKKKDPETIEELNRKKQYLEKSIGTLQASTSINQSKTKLNINKRRHENVSLISNLEQVRESKKQLQIILEGKQRQIGMLKLEKQKKEREFTKKLNVICEQIFKEKRSDLTAGLAKKETTQDPESDQIYKRVNSGEIGGFYETSKVKGKLYKGTPFIRGNAEDKLKIAELGSQLEENNQQILLQKLEKRSLQEQIIRLLDERADDLGLSEEEKRAQLNRLNIQPLIDQNQTFGGDTQHFINPNNQ